MHAADRLLDFLSPTVFAPLDARLRGDRSRSFAGEAEALTAAPAERIEAFQLERIRAIAAHAARHTRFYAERFAEAGIARPEAMTWEQFRGLPCLTREDLRQRHEDLASDAFAPRERIATATGGTTSSPIPFLLDRESHWRRWGATLAFDAWLGYRPGLRIAYLWGARQDAPGKPSWKGRLRGALVSRNRFFPSGLLDEAILDGYARELQAFRPVLLQAYPTPLAIFARHLLQRCIRLTIPALSCTAEPLLPAQRETIRAAFGRAPVNWYGARECGRIATECQRLDGLHVNVYGLHVELLPLPDMPAEGVGEIVVTDLWNRALPLIRYRIRDLGRLDAAPCACGRGAPRLRDILGRTADTFVNSRGQRVPGVAFTNRLVTDGRRIEALQLLQHEPRRFEALVVAGPDYDAATPEWLRSRLAAFLEDDIELTLRPVEAIPREASGKLRVAKNLMDGAG